jgi:hypothetical protein
VLAAFGIAVAVAGAQDFTFSAVAKDGGLPVGVGIANRGVTGAGTQLLALDSNPPGVRIWNAGAYGSSSFYPTNVGAVSSLAVLPGLAGGDGVVVLGAAGVALGSAGAGGLTFRATPFNAFDAVDVAVGDFNGDGLQDIAFVEPQEGERRRRAQRRRRRLPPAPRDRHGDRQPRRPTRGRRLQPRRG